MSPINLDQLLQHEAFRGLSEPAQQRLRERMELLSFELGEQLVEEEPNNPQYWTLLGNCYAKVKRGEDSLRAHKRAQDLQAGK